MLGLDVQLKQTRFYQEIAEEEREVGMREGMLKGKMEGKLEGKLEGERLLLKKLLIKRFGPLPDWTLQQMQQADVNQLEAWSDRIFDAESLDSVFE